MSKNTTDKLIHWMNKHIPWLPSWYSVLVGVLSLAFGVLLGCFLVVAIGEPDAVKYFEELLGVAGKNDALTFLGIGMGGVLLALQALIAHRRAKAMESAARAQADAARAQAMANEHIEQGQRQERLKNAIEHLGHSSDSVRLGGAFELFHLAEDTPTLRQTVLDILCAHIRRTTNEVSYQEEYGSVPSEEIQSLLTLLFVREHAVFESLHINLQGSWLNGAELARARLHRVELDRAHLKRASLAWAQMQAASLIGANLQNATLRGTCLQLARLPIAKLHGANLEQVQLQAALATGAYFQGAALAGAQLHGARLNHAKLQGAHLADAQLQGASLQNAKFGGNPGKIGFTSFQENKRRGIGTDCQLTEVTFEGGITHSQLDQLVEGLPDDHAENLRKKLEPHIGRPANNELSVDRGASIEPYSEAEAESWIAEF